MGIGRRQPAAFRPLSRRRLCLPRQRRAGSRRIPELRAVLADAGFPLLAQTVLLAGVNNTSEALANLLRACIECRIKPYYLHHADLAPGTTHLRTDIESGQALMRALRGRLSGLCQPTYVLDIPGGHGKSPIGPNYLTRAGADEHLVVEDYKGQRHRYPPLL